MMMTIKGSGHLSDDDKDDDDNNGDDEGYKWL